jgi:hypothetical protein
LASDGGSKDEHGRGGYGTVAAAWSAACPQIVNVTSVPPLGCLADGGWS